MRDPARPMVNNRSPPGAHSTKERVKLNTGRNHDGVLQICGVSAREVACPAPGAGLIIPDR
jgi:hypothetical protein